MRNCQNQSAVIWSLILFFVYLLTFSNATQAFQSTERDLIKDALSADAVIHGIVSAVDYRKSSDGLPHTFVTYQVLNTIAGETDSELVLRFIGGPDGRGGIFLFPNTPIFNVADEDILFVRGNGKSTCPLVSCELGRLRVSSNKVYNNLGLPMVILGNGPAEFRGSVNTKLLKRRFPRPTFEQLLNNPSIAKQAARLRLSGSSIEEMKLSYQKQSPEYIELTTSEIVIDENINRSKLMPQHVEGPAIDLGSVFELFSNPSFLNHRSTNLSPMVHSLVIDRAFQSGLEQASTQISMPSVSAKTPTPTFQKGG